MSADFKTDLTGTIRLRNELVSYDLTRMLSRTLVLQGFRATFYGFDLENRKLMVCVVDPGFESRLRKISLENPS